MLSVRLSEREVADRVRTGAGGAHNPGCFRYTTATTRRVAPSPPMPAPPVSARCGWNGKPEADRSHHGSTQSSRTSIGEAGTAGLEPAASRLTSERSARLSYAPVEVRGWDSNPRSRAHEAREDNRSSTAQVWLAGVEPAISGARSRRGANSPTARRRSSNTPGGTRTRSFRVEGPASSPLRPRGHLIVARRPGVVTARRVVRAPAAGLEPALSRVTTARLANSTTPERTAEAAGLEPANGSEPSTR